MLTNPRWARGKVGVEPEPKQYETMEEESTTGYVPTTPTPWYSRVHWWLIVIALMFVAAVIADLTNTSPSVNKWILIIGGPLALLTYIIQKILQWKGPIEFPLD
jgi:hypothetical protein